MNWHEEASCGPDATRHLLRHLEQSQSQSQPLPLLSHPPLSQGTIDARAMMGPMALTVHKSPEKMAVLEQEFNRLWSTSMTSADWRQEFQKHSEAQAQGQAQHSAHWKVNINNGSPWTNAFLQEHASWQKHSESKAWALQFAAQEQQQQLFLQSDASSLGTGKEDLTAQAWQALWSEKAFDTLDLLATTQGENTTLSTSLDDTCLSTASFEESWQRATQSNTCQPSHSMEPLDYVFEIENVYLNHPAPYQEGLRLKQVGSLTDAALAFEASLQQNERQRLALVPLDEEGEANLVLSWLYLAEIQAENEKEAAAIAAYRQCLRLSPRHPKALMGLAISYTNEGVENEVLVLLCDWLSSQYPASAHIQVLKEATGSVLDRRDAIISAYLNVIRSTLSHPDPELQVGLGILFYNSSQYDKAIDCFHAALQSRPEDYLLWNRLGATLANSHRSEEAIAKYEQALALKPTFVRARHNLGVSCMNIGCYKEAAAHLLNALSCCHSARSMNISTNLWETLRRDFVYMNRQDLARICDERNLEFILNEMKSIL